MIVFEYIHTHVPTYICLLIILIFDYFSIEHNTGKTTTMEYNKVCICTALCNVSSTIEIAEKLIDHNIVQEVCSYMHMHMWRHIA